ncbi:MAG: squalene synthase [Flavobacteriaceae bacterium]
MSIVKSITRPMEISALLKFKFGAFNASSKHYRQEYDCSNKAYCFDTLDKVSRSFATVIRQLPSELSVVVCLFYLVLRALDSVEDDMDLPRDVKIRLLKDFYKKNYEKGWSITEVGDKEQYRELLENYDKIIMVFLSVDFKYQEIITDTCRSMGKGMAEFVEREVDTIEDYNLYCHYVAGLVGIGLSRIFSASGLEDEHVQLQEGLANSMGLFLQKTNIVRDYKEDLDEKRIFWPGEIWRQYARDFEYFSRHPESKDSQACLNHMVNDALSHAVDCLDYLKEIRNKQIFKFCAIPQVMAMATLCEVYNNPKVFVKNVKIRKGFAAKLFLNTNTIEDVLRTYRALVNEIEKNIPSGVLNSEETLMHIRRFNAYCSVESAKS